MPRESMTLKDLDDAGRDVRAWCDACQRAGHVDTIIWELFEAKGWPMALDDAATHFRCRACGSGAHVTLTPCDRPPQAHTTGTDIVAAIFFGARAKGKKRRRAGAPDPSFETHRVRWWGKRR